MYNDGKLAAATTDLLVQKKKITISIKMLRSLLGVLLLSIPIEKHLSVFHHSPVSLQKRLITIRFNFKLIGAFYDLSASQ